MTTPREQNDGHFLCSDPPERERPKVHPEEKRDTVMQARRIHLLSDEPVLGSKEVFPAAQDRVWE